MSKLDVLKAIFLSKFFFSSFYLTAKYSPLREDLERNDGSLERPYYMSKSLKQILGKMEKTASEQARFRPGSYAHY